MDGGIDSNVHSHPGQRRPRWPGRALPARPEVGAVRGQGAVPIQAFWSGVSSARVTQTFSKASVPASVTWA